MVLKNKTSLKLAPLVKKPNYKLNFSEDGQVRDLNRFPLNNFKFFGLWFARSTQQTLRSAELRALSIAGFSMGHGSTLIKRPRASLQAFHLLWNRFPTDFELRQASRIDLILQLHDQANDLGFRMGSSLFTRSY
jgi:hypothetical protein